MPDLATLIPLDRHEDVRGSFTEAFRDEWLRNRDRPPVQVSICFSRRGTLRGMHRHLWHGDFWFLASGKIQVGLHRNGKSETFTIGTEAAVYIPAGTWHGFLALEDTTLVYIQDAYYDPADEFVARWDSCGIEWDLDDLEKWRRGFPSHVPFPVLSERDRNATPLSGGRT